MVIYNSIPWTWFCWKKRRKKFSFFFGWYFTKETLLFRKILKWVRGPYPSPIFSFGSIGTVIPYNLEQSEVKSDAVTVSYACAKLVDFGGLHKPMGRGWLPHFLFKRKLEVSASHPYNFELHHMHVLWWNASKSTHHLMHLGIHACACMWVHA